MIRAIRLAVLALLAGLPAAARAEWHEASSRHFLVFSEGKEETLRDFAVKLEKFDSAMRLRLGLVDEDLGPANRVTVYVVDDTEAVRRLGRFGSGAAVAGFYYSRAGGSIAVTPRSTGEKGKFALEPATILLHEYSHHIMLQNSSMAYPAWFREGFAEFNSTARFEADGSLGFGAAANHRAWGLIGLNPQPIEVLFDPARKKLTAFEWEATIYGRGWLLTHYLFFDEARRGQLAAYISALNAGKSSLDAARAAFGDLAKLDQELKAYLARKTLPYLRLKGEALKVAPVTVRTLRPGEAAQVELRMRSDVGVTSEDAAKVAKAMAAAARNYPDDAAVQANLAEAMYDAADYDGAEAAADRALAAEPRNVQALLYKARTRMARARMAKTPDPAAWKEIRRLIGIANRVDPNDPEPLILFYSSFEAQGVAPTRNAVEGLLQAFALAPQDSGLRLTAAHQLLVDGKGAEARAALSPLAYDPHGGAAAQAVMGVIARLDAGGTKAALEAWDSLTKPTEPEAKKKS